MLAGKKLQRRRRRQWLPLLIRISRPFGDVILLAQLLGAAANAVWYLELSTSDLVGFVYVGGDLAGLLAYFSFMLFGLLFFFLSPHRFWRSLHPLNFGIGLMLLATHRLWSAQSGLIITALLAGMLAGRFLFRQALTYPRWTLIVCVLLIPLGRFALPYWLAPYAITSFGALLAMLVCAPTLLHLLRPSVRAGGALR